MTPATTPALTIFVTGIHTGASCMLTYGRKFGWVVAFGFAAVSHAGADTALDLSTLGTARHSGDLSPPRPASRAIDGSTALFSETTDAPNSFWEVELGWAVPMSRVELVAPSGLDYAGVVNGLVLRISDLRDRTLFQATVSGVLAGGTWSTNLPSGVAGRIVRFGLENGIFNEAGDQRVAIAEVRVFGDPSPAHGPVALGAGASVSQSSTASAANAASSAIDGDPGTYSQTQDLPDSHWLLSFDRSRPIQRIELINRADGNASRLEGLTLRVLDDDSNSVAVASITNPGAGATWSFDAPPGTEGRHVRIGLENGAVNGQGNGIVSLAEINVLTATNYALGTEAYMLRFSDNLPPASNGNDGDYATHTETTERTVDAYWETDLGETRALYSVRVVAADGFQGRMTHATVRLFDEAHDSVFSQHLAGTSPTFDIPLPGAVNARYVRVGFENKERSHPTGGIEWWLGIKEVQAFGRPLTDAGTLEFTASEYRINAGESTRLLWRESDLYALSLYPRYGSVGALTAMDGTGEVTVKPTISVEYLLVGSNYNGTMTRHVTIEVDGQRLPPRINEFMASNRLSLRDGNRDAPDWIELHNPNNDPLDLTGHGLSDDPSAPMKWVFPEVIVPPHGYLIVFASGRDEPFDEAGFLHADFSLNAGGESIVLTAPDGETVLDSVIDYPPQREDLAYGFSIERTWPFVEPTPGEPNIAPAYEGWLQPLVFSHSRGFHTNAFTLTITNPNADSEIFYSLDGTEPSVTYTGPLSVDGTVTVRAAVRRDRFKPPRTQTHTYVFLDDVVASPNMDSSITQDRDYGSRIRQGLMDLPSICISVPELPDDWNEREASVEIFWPDGSPPTQANCGVERFGGAWTTFAKKSYQLKFRARYGLRKLEAPLFRGFDRGFQAVEAFDEIDLRAGNHDAVSRGFYMAARFTEDTMLDMGSLNPHGRYVHVYFNGVYWGQYHARERLVDVFLGDYLGRPTEEFVNVRGNDNGPGGFVPGMPDPLHREPWEYVLANRGSYEAIKDRVDLPHFIDFMLMWNYGNAESEFRAAGPIEPGSGFKFWLGDADGYLRTSALNLDQTGNSGPGQIFGALVSEGHPDFMTLLADRIYLHLFNDGALTPARNEARLNERMHEIRNSLIAECARWGYRTPSNWESAAQTIRTDLFPYRTDNLFARLRNRGLYPPVNPPVFNQHGGSVSNGFALTLTAGPGTVYYTLDGTDPRLAGGEVSPNAIAWSSQSIQVPLGSDWRYWDQGAPPSSSWQDPGYDDSAWSSGSAPLGYGNGNEATVLGYGPDSGNKHPAAYFRHSFMVTDVADIPRLTVDLVRDDGAVVYLNGTELLRDNMPGGTVTHTTLALSAIGGSAEETPVTFDVPAGLLVEGLNVLAVEVHQASVTSSDLRFDLGLGAAASTQLILEEETRIRARVWNGSTWSALTDARFLMAEPHPPSVGDLLITELHYNPAGSDDYEFLEVMNLSSNLVDLSGARVADGVEFLFPNGYYLAPGGFALVVENATAFDERYRTPSSPYYYPNLSVAGEWSGRLANDGERIALVDSNGVELVVVDYGTGGAWPGRADGDGSSLELRDPAAAVADPAGLEAYLDRGAHWRSSSLYHGSPGRLDGVPRNLVISEVVAHTDTGVDWVELQNVSPEPVDLTGLFLSDHYDQPLRYPFPEDTVFDSGGFLVLSADELGFGFSELGSDILLIEASGTNVIRFIDTVDFPAVEREEPLGRYARSDGIVDFTELLSVTPGEPNAAPRVGPVVFSEILYKPSGEFAEFVELVNITGTHVALYDPARPTNTWELSDAVEFSFPPGQEIAPGALILVCNTNPAAFRQQHGLDDSVPVYGPWTGALNNAGESIRLRRPGDPEPDGTVPYYRVDRVRYEPVAPWPIEADSGGISLERVELAAYGNDPANWQPSAAGGTPGSLPGNRPPSLQPIPDAQHPAGIPFEISVTASDPDLPPQTLGFSASGLPDGVDIDPATGRMSGTAESTGVFSVTVTVSDQQPSPLTASRQFTLTITEPFHLQWMGSGPGDPPGFSFQAIAGETYEVHFSYELSPPDWQLLERIESAAGGLQSIPAPPNPDAPRCFVRVIWMRGNF